MQQDQNRRDDRVGQDLDVRPRPFPAGSAGRGHGQLSLDVVLDLSSPPDNQLAIQISRKERTRNKGY